jgi:outer membrane protein OmpA-like peptidoglycan-associated protein
MRNRAFLIAGCLGLSSAIPSVQAQQSAVVRAELQPRSTTVYRLRDGKRATFDVRGIGGQVDAGRGTLEIEYKNGKALMHLEVDSLVHPQRVGTAYTAYVLWGVTADGKVTRLEELPVNKRIDLRTDLTAQTVGLLATAEPYAEVERPSSELVLKFTLLNTADRNAPIVGNARYMGDGGQLYGDASAKADVGTPLLVQSARHAVAVARRSGAVEYAPAEWRQVDVKLEVLEQLWPDNRRNESKFAGPAREVIRLAEAARRIGAERADSAAVAAERAASAASLARAAGDVDAARRLKAEAEQDAARARAAADSANQVAAQARASADSANQASMRTLGYAESVRAAAGAAASAAQQEAMAAQQEAANARRERDNARARLAASIGAILDTKREARGLVVNLSGVFFMSGKAELQPQARENLSKLSGILAAYPGPYVLAIGGHTDSVGSDAMNDKLSQARAESVRNYLIQAGVAESHMASATGYGKHQPVADNATAAGRAKNRRVEIIINDSDPAVE